MMARTLSRMLLSAILIGPSVLSAQQGASVSTTAPMPLSLDEALRLAAGTSESVALARAGEQRARGQQAQARTAVMPQLATTPNWHKQLQNPFAGNAKELPFFFTK